MSARTTPSSHDMTRQQLEAFASLEWATPFLTSPDWVVRERTRGSGPDEDTDRFGRETMRANNSINHWLELYETPAPGQRITKSLSLCSFGAGLIGFPGIAHGGALLTLMDEALAFVMVANEQREHGQDFAKLGEETWKHLQAEGASPQDVIKGKLVMAGLNVKFWNQSRARAS